LHTILDAKLDLLLDMKNIIPITDLQRQAAQILGDLDNEPIVITQRGRASAVLLSARRYAEIEEDLQLLDDLELLQMVEESKRAIADGDTISNEEVKKRLNFKE
jgi:prevent-host-death family protein